MIRRPLLGNTFVRRRPEQIWRFYGASGQRLFTPFMSVSELYGAAWGLDKHQALYLKEMFYPLLVCDTLLKKVASRPQKLFLSLNRQEMSLNRR